MGSGPATVHLADRRDVFILPDDYAKGLWPGRGPEWYVLDMSDEEMVEETLADRRSPLRACRFHSWVGRNGGRRWSSRTGCCTITK